MLNYKTVEIRVSNTYELPDFYNQDDPAIHMEALTMGAFLHNQMTIRRANADVQKAEEQKQKDVATMKEQIAKIKADATNKQALLESHIAEIEQSVTEKQTQLLEAQKLKDAAIYAGEKETILKQHDAKLRALNADNAILIEQKRVLEARCNQMLADRDKDIETAIERNVASFQRTLDEKDSTNQLLRDMLESQKTAMEALREDFRQFSEEHLKKTLNSRNKGAEYENQMATKLKIYYGSNPTFSLVEKSKSSSGHEADILMEWNNKSVLWEAKNYSDTVNKTQVDKFHRDMKTNPHVLVGIMMSRFTTIVGKASRGDFFTEIEGDQLLIYVSNSDAFGDTLYHLLPHLWTAHWEAQSKKVRHEDEERDKVMRMIDELISKVAKRKTEWVGMKSHFMKGIHWMSDAIEEDETQLKKVLNLLKSGEKENHVDSVWESVFMELDDGTDMEYTMGIIKKICAPESNSFITLNDFAEMFRKYSPEPKPSVDAAKKTIRSLLIPDRLDAQKGKAIIVHGLKLTVG